MRHYLGTPPKHPSQQHIGCKRCNGFQQSLYQPVVNKRRAVQAPASAAAVVVAAAAAAGASPPASREVVVGIDLGTTNSAVAYIVDGQPVCIPNSLGDTLTPSVVSFQPDGITTVGRAAKQAQGKNPSTTYYSVKRLIGRSWSSPAVQEEAQRLAYTVSWTPWRNSMPYGMRDWTHCLIMNTSAPASAHCSHR